MNSPSLLNPPRRLGTALVTGGAGFLGSHLCRRLRQQGRRVICVDDFSTGRPENLDELRADSDFVLLEADVSAGLPVEEPVELIFHFASSASPPAYLARPIETLAVSSAGTTHALEMAARHGARLILASTSEVYGDPLEHPQTESYWGNVNPIGPRSCYDEAKRFAEALCMAYHRDRGVDVGIVRIFNTYGPRMRPDDGRVVSNFLLQALRGRPLTLYGSGDQTRSFCYVDDEIDGIMALVESSLVGPVNIGNPGEFTIRELAELVLEVTGSGSSLVYQPLPEDDPRQRRPDISLAQSKLGWSPSVGLKDGLHRTAEWLVRARGTL